MWLNDAGMFTVTDFIKILLKYHSASQVLKNVLFFAYAISGELCSSFIRM